MSRFKLFARRIGSIPQALSLRGVLTLAAVLLCLATENSVRVLSAAEESAKVSDWKSLFDGKTLKNWKSAEFGGEGDVAVKNGMIEMQQGSEITGVTWTGGDLPKMNYEISLMAQRIDGSDFFCGLTFQINEAPCSFIVGGWGWRRGGNIEPRRIGCCK